MRLTLRSSRHTISRIVTTWSIKGDIFLLRVNHALDFSFLNYEDQKPFHFNFWFWRDRVEARSPVPQSDNTIWSHFAQRVSLTMASTYDFVPKTSESIQDYLTAFRTKTTNCTFYSLHVARFLILYTTAPLLRYLRLGHSGNSFVPCGVHEIINDDFLVSMALFYV